MQILEEAHDESESPRDWAHSNQKFMCNLPISEAKAIELHQNVKNGIKQFNKKLKLNNLKPLVR